MVRNRQAREQHSRRGNTTRVRAGIPALIALCVGCGPKPVVQTLPAGSWPDLARSLQALVRR